MKKIFAILFLPVILASGLQVSIDHHYCGGVLAATKISVTGKLASCGMEEQERSCSNQTSVEKNCCEDQIKYFGVNSNYIPEYSNISLSSKGKDIPACPQYDLKLYDPEVIYHTSWVMPPGDIIKLRPSLSEICVFRI